MSQRCTAVLFVLLLGAVVGCGVHTRAAVRNDGAEPVDVTLTSGDGKDTVSFTRIAPATTSAFQKLGFASYRGVVVRQGGGDGSAVDLTPEQDNTVVVEPGKKPAVKSVYNEDNEWW